ncbi:MaoC family dehydratase [Streptomonospora litoralis]|uniref:Bifunctional enoyl-CoA hydratase/phosphate acetyltransferase n=1 Tax=Streptomonospora litoralis TaxID=2498135 RepID=A0A4P6Q5L8_9ACTN|nr:MaoC family dehydratase [Streptomonospora litoralis]QBI55985.1 bifunctional enoyl-CoA hydratase/phosphate acetyltransferase [Streptomonospora litoralis]
MTAIVRYADVETGTEIPEQVYPVRRIDLIRYAGASGDFNPIHWNERTAKAVGLPDVIAHGMFTMAQAGRLVTDWAGDPGALVEYKVRFSAPVVVPDDDNGAEISVSGVVKEKLDDNLVRIALTARSGGAKVLARSTALVRLA